MGRLDGRVAFITGAAGGMGVEHARLFVEEGAKVVISDIAVDAGIMLAKELGDAAIFVHHDVSSPDSWESAVEWATAAFGPITVLVNNAGSIGPKAKLADLAVDDYLKTVSIDQHGVFYGMRAVIPGMIEAGGGSIVNFSSVAGFVHSVNVPNAAYTAAKFAVRGLTKAAAVQYGDKNIRVNSIHPGPVLTPMLATAVTKDKLDGIGAGVPLSRLAQPREVSQVVLFLASAESSYVTGAEYLVDGGYTAD